MAKKGFVPWNAGTSRTKVTVVCENCGVTCEKYLHGRARVRFCSNKCAHEQMDSPTKGKFGKEHPKWKYNKITPFRKQLRFTYEYKCWREEVFTRDDFTCQDCGERGGTLEAHHIKPFSKILDDYEILTYEEAINCEQLWSVDNGVTFCVSCHIKNDIKRN